MSLPYSMEPAPIRAEQQIIGPVDLGAYSDGEYAGWKIVIDRSAPLGASEAVANAIDNDDSNGDKIRAMYRWIASVVVAWNFTTIVLEKDGTTHVEPLPQPREGGAQLIPQALIPPLSRAVNEVLNPSKKP